MIAIVLVALGAGGWWAWGQRNPAEVSGNSTEEFVTTDATPTTSAATDTAQNWPTYGFDNARTRWNPNLHHKPPFTTDWTFHAGSLLELADSRGHVVVGGVGPRRRHQRQRGGSELWVVVFELVLHVQ